MDNNNNSQKINIIEIINIFLNYWPLLVISCIIFLSAGLFYYKFSSKTYAVYARVALMGDHNNSNRGSSAYVSVSDLMNQEKDFANEVSYLRSTPLIKEVVKDMNLFITYYIKEDKIPHQLHFSLNNMYKSSPFMVVIEESSPQPINTLFYLKVIDDEHFMLSAKNGQTMFFDYNKETLYNYEDFFKIEGIYKFGDVIRNDYCAFKIILNSIYDEKLYKGKDLYFEFNNPTFLAYKIQQSLSIKSAFYQSSLADMNFEWGNLDLARDFLTKLIDKYIEKNLEKKNFNANNTIAYIDGLLTSVSGSLGQSEQQLRNFRANQNVMNITEKASSVFSQIQDLQASISDARSRYQYLIQISDYFDANKDVSTFVPPSLVGLSDITLTTLIQELTTLTTERQALITQNQFKNPRLKTLDANIANIKEVVSENINLNISTTQSELSDLNKRLVSLEREYSSFPETQRALTNLERSFSINDEVYSSLLDKRMQAQILKASTLPDCEIIEPARYVDLTAPDLKKIGLITVFLGLFFPSIYIVIVNFFTQQVRTKEEHKRYCNLPAIGNIPHNDKPENNVIVNYPQSPVAERFRFIKSNLIYYLFGEVNKSILITSTLPDEGKSFVALNLAASFASMQNKTVLVGFDLRKASRIFDGLKPDEFQIGIVNYLINKVEIDDIIVSTSIPNLDFIPSGQVPPDPVALISTLRTKILIEELKRRYNYVIIDSPPFGLVTDPFLLMQYADLSLYISRLGAITKKALKTSMEEINSKAIKNIYVIYNDLKGVDKDYAQKYTYGESSNKMSSKKFLKLFRRK